MTIDEAIKVINSSLELSYFDITKEALTMAIEALKQQEEKKADDPSHPFADDVLMEVEQ